MPKVYRIEHKELPLNSVVNKGAYSVPEVVGLSYLLIQAHGWREDKPSLWYDFEDIIALRGKTHIQRHCCACSSISNLQVWFEEFLYDLLDSGEFVAVEYEVSYYIKSNQGIQCVMPMDIGKIRRRRVLTKNEIC